MRNPSYNGIDDLERNEAYKAAVRQERNEVYEDRKKGFKAFFESIPASNDAHLKIELFDDNEIGDDVQSVEAWRHCGHEDMLYFCVNPWKSENGLVLNASNARLLADVLLAYSEAQESPVSDVPQPKRKGE